MTTTIGNTSSEVHPIYINGEWVESSGGRTFEQRNPACLSEITGCFQASTADDTRRAIDAAEQAFPKWRDTPPLARAEILKKVLAKMIERREEIARVLTLENGKLLSESLGEINSAIREMEFQIAEGVRSLGEVMPVSMPGVLAYHTRQPLGVVGIITPWNFPFNVPTRKCAPALMAGNTCVFKPASLTPQTGLRFTELFTGAGLPPGVLNFVTGGPRDVGDTIVTDPRIKAISLTGSTDVGIQINEKASSRLARTQLELGGKNPVVVLKDANLDDAVNATVTAAYACAGQWCTSTSRAIVAREIAGEFIQRVIQKAGALRVGNGLDAETGMGPVCGTAQMRSILAYIEKGLQEGAKLLLGGKQMTDGACADGCFIEPTVFGAVTPEMTIAQEEIFGPVLSVIEFGSLDEAIEIANGVKYGLASSVFTNNLKSALTFLERTEVGLTHVNMVTAYKEPQLTFGGIKQSGHGIPEAGKTGIEFFTEHKVAYVKYS
ncbi:MAG: aldehyde dehydrogenase family protein [bacterium]|nr:aldehyde dehydrogenase family protein [Candidatus Sumerlaeota bacterium]